MERLTIAGFATPEKLPDSVRAALDDPYRDRDVPEIQRELRARAAEHRSRIAREFGGERFAESTFATFRVTDANRPAFTAAQAYLAGERSGLGLVGSNGTGKTHLANAIANAVLEKGQLAISTPVHALLAKIRGSWDGEGGTEAAIVARYASVAVLILDDLGKNDGSRWAVETLFALVDLRYARGLGLIVTTNRTPAELIAAYTDPKRGADASTANALVDRLLEMTASPWIAMRGRSERSGNSW